jgi:hypothetical protein
LLALAVEGVTALHPENEARSESSQVFSAAVSSGVGVLSCCSRRSIFPCSSLRAASCSGVASSSVGSK